jgi:hypothetical protein
LEPNLFFQNHLYPILCQLGFSTANNRKQSWLTNRKGVHWNHILEIKITRRHDTPVENMKDHATKNTANISLLERWWRSTGTCFHCHWPLNSAMLPKIWAKVPRETHEQLTIGQMTCRGIGKEHLITLVFCFRSR